MLRGLTPRRTASSWPLQSCGGWLVMMAVIRSRRVGGPGGRGRGGVLRSRRGRAGVGSTGGGVVGVLVGAVAAGGGGGAAAPVQAPGGGGFVSRAAEPGRASA